MNNVFNQLEFVQIQNELLVKLNELQVLYQDTDLTINSDTLNILNLIRHQSYTIENQHSIRYKELKYETESVMNSETLRVFIKQVMEDPNQQTGIVWQGGEPTLVGVDFYQQAISYMVEFGKNRHKTISNLLQTNGFYISDPLVKLLKKCSFLVGLSLDGPEEIHDYHRKTKGGGSHFSSGDAKLAQIERS